MVLEYTYFLVGTVSHFRIEQMKISNFYSFSLDNPSVLVQELITRLNVLLQHLWSNKKNSFSFPQASSFRRTCLTCHINCPFLQSV